MKAQMNERLIIAGLTLVMLTLTWLAVVFSYEAIPASETSSDMQEFMLEQGQTKVNFVDSE